MLRKLECYYEDYCESIRKEADILREERMPEITEELFAIYENTGNRLVYEAVYFRRRKFLAVFGLKAMLDRQERDIAKLEEILTGICAEECWALPAHVNRKEDKDWRIYVDLFASETAQTLSEITASLEDVLSGDTVRAVRDEVMRRVLRPFAASRAPYSHWEYGSSNWCAVCGGSIGSAAMYLMKDRPEELMSLLERICHSLRTYYLDSFAQDGACLEGLGYFTYGMTYFTGFAQQLYEFMGGGQDLFRIEKLAEIAAFQAKCYFQSGRTVSFADGYTDDTFQMGLTCFLAMKYPGAGIPPMERAAGLNDDSCYRFMGLYRNLIWTRAYIEFLRGRGAGMIRAYEGSCREESLCARHRAGRMTVLPDAQWVICQSENGAGMAAKGGHNAEPHNHNDVGSFLYLRGQDFLLTDLGCGEYTRGYFSENRYEYLCCRSLGHNLPIVDGGEQLAGREYYSDAFETDGRGRTVISFAGAYGNPKLQSLVRTLDWNGEDGTLQVEDLFRFTEPPRSLKENLITPWKPEIQGNVIRIQGTQNGCEIRIEGPAVEAKCTRWDFNDHGGCRRDVWLIQWEISAADRAGQTSVRFLVKGI